MKTAATYFSSFSSALSFLGFIGILFVFLFGCRASGGPSLELHQLHTETWIRSQSPVEQVIGLGPITLASHLDRPQIVRRDAQGRLHIHHLHRWEGSLEQSLRTQLAVEMTEQQPHWSVQSHPWYRQSGVKVQVKLHIDSFESDTDQNVVLSGSLETIPIKRPSEAIVLHFHFQEKSESQGIDSQVKSMRKLSHQLSQKIIDSISRVTPSRKAPKALPVSERSR